ncbi:S-layer homology domain-containing protein [Paenibacillus sp. FSL L8-0463]|uniref:S-layer homology domain-containing protein n=1 Tax=Paenibacillus sp. FSL L8-0463 TaxID=2954687 RepID=UPI003119EAC4
MTLKKKLAVSTLAVSMAAASVAGFPFSSQGLAKHLGGVASAASVDNATLKARADLLYANLGDSGRAALRATRAEINEKIDSAKFNALFAPVLDNLQPDVNKTELYNLFNDVASVYYDLNYTDLKDIRNNEAYTAVLKQIAADAGVAELTVDDVIDFVLGVETSLKNLVSNKTTAELVTLAKNPGAQEKLFDDAIDVVLGATAGANKYTVSTVLNNLGVSKADIKASVNAVRAELTTDKEAATQLALAYISAFGLGYNPGGGGTGGGGVAAGGTTTTTLTPAEAFAKASIFDASKYVVITGDKATVKLVDADILAAFDKLVAAAKAVGYTGPLTLTLDLGPIKVSTVEVPLSEVIVDAATAKGIANMGVTYNSLTVTIPMAQFSTEVALTVTTAADTTVTSITKLKLASSVYDFGFTVKNVPTTTFKQPLTIKLPLKDTTGLDKELLSVAKVVYSNLQFQGGVLDGEYIVEPRDTFSSYAVLENKVSFSDIAKVQAWAGRQIQVVAAKGAIEGIGNGKFAPKNNVTRAEFAKMLVRALNLENSTATESFTDVSSTAWYAPYVAVAAEKGIIQGRTSTTFDPTATITRAEMATLISRALKLTHPDAKTDASALSKFSDAAKISATLKDGVAFAASNNLVIGDAGKFNPTNTASRAEAAVIIYRTINFK